jgi:K+-transporting ATPase c subunit
MSVLLRPLLVLFVLLTVLTGLVYPWVVTGIGKLAFPNQVSGSLVTRDGRAVGSPLSSASPFRIRSIFGADESGAARRGQGAHRGAQVRRSRQ